MDETEKGILCFKYNSIIFQKKLFDLEFDSEIRNYSEELDCVVVFCRTRESDYVADILSAIHNEFELQMN